MILLCICQNEFQDQKLGKNKRVHNKITKVDNKARCTVCKKENSIK